MRSTHLGLFTYGEQIGFLLKCVVYFANAGKSFSLLLISLAHSLTSCSCDNLSNDNKSSSIAMWGVFSQACAVCLCSGVGHQLTLTLTHPSALSITPLFWHNVTKVTVQINLDGLFNRSSHCKVNLFGLLPSNDLITLIILILSGNYCLARIALINLYPKWSEEST